MAGIGCSHLRLLDVRRVFNLIGEIRDRDGGDPPFTKRDRDMLRLFMIELYRLYRNGKLAPQEKDFRLSPRQQQVLKQMLSGKDTQRIADHLGISPRTIDKHTRTLYDKFGVRHRGELIARCVKKAVSPLDR